jgi:hypothetical protein
LRMGVGRLDGKGSYDSETEISARRKTGGWRIIKDERASRGNCPWETIGLLNATWRQVEISMWPRPRCRTDTPRFSVVTLGSSGRTGSARRQVRYASDSSSQAAGSPPGPFSGWGFKPDRC